MKNKILSLIRNDSKLTPDRIAVMLGVDQGEVERMIAELEAEKVIVGYRPIINYDKLEEEVVTAFIELKVTPQRNEGFDRVAERIYQYDQVVSVFLMSGAFDLFVEVRGKTMKEVALFVAEKLAPMDAVVSTATHFVLRPYKYDGVIFAEGAQDEREMIMF